jgi:hypothetical protein
MLLYIWFCNKIHRRQGDQTSKTSGFVMESMLLHRGSALAGHVDCCALLIPVSCRVSSRFYGLPFKALALASWQVGRLAARGRMPFLPMLMGGISMLENVDKKVLRECNMSSGSQKSGSNISSLTLFQILKWDS